MHQARFKVRDGKISRHSPCIHGVPLRNPPRVLPPTTDPTTERAIGRGRHVPPGRPPSVSIRDGSPNTERLVLWPATDVRARGLIQRRTGSREIHDIGVHLTASGGTYWPNAVGANDFSDALLCVPAVLIHNLPAAPVHRTLATPLPAPAAIVERLLGLVCAAALVLVANPLHAQQPTQEADSSVQDLDRPVRVFLDCDRCYTSYMRRNLTFVDYVRDRQQADVHVLGTRRQTGGGGSAYRLELIGQGPFAGLRFQQSYNAASTLTQDEQRRGLADALRAGLLPFASRTPEGDHLDVTYSPPTEGEERGPTPEEDPWNQWVFDIGASGSFDLQEQEHSYEIEGDVSAERITQVWKLNFRADGQHEVDVFEQEDTTDIRSTSEDYEFDGEVIKTLGPKSGTGLTTSVFSRSFTNIDVGTRLRAAVEYNLFPYSISDQKELTFTYRIGPEYRRYREITIFEETEETLVQQSASVSLDLNRTWGSVFARLEASNYFHDLSKNSVEFFSFINIRLIEGLSLRLNFNAERIQDQLSLAAGGLTDEEILLRRQQRATSFAVGGSIGLSYTFGSIYNNVVNTRLGGGGGGRRGFF